MSSESPMDVLSSAASIFNATTMGSMPANVRVDDPNKEVTPIFLQTQAAKGNHR